MSNLESSNGKLASRRCELRRRLAANVGSARSARRELLTLARHLAPSELEIAALLTSELVSNSVRHSGTAPTGVVQLNVALDAHLLRVEVQDEGPGFAPVQRPAEELTVGQWGLQLVHELADRWGVSPDTGDTTVWFELDRAR